MPKLVYLDNAATTWPKPRAVTKAMAHFMERVGANPGRSGHRLSVAAACLLYQARQEIAALLGCHDPLRVVFCANATAALNIALHGLLRLGDHAVRTSMEHNSVMRPLRALEQQEVLVSVVQCLPSGELPVEAVERSLNPRTRLLVATHASNVVRTLLPLDELVDVARRHEVLLLVDAAQGAGAIPIDLRRTPVDLLAFTGHKALFGPPGTGGLIIGQRVPLQELTPLFQGAPAACRRWSISRTFCRTSRIVVRPTWQALPASPPEYTGCAGAGWRRSVRTSRPSRGNSFLVSRSWPA